MQEPTDAWPEAIALPTKSQRGPPPLSARPAPIHEGPLAQRRCSFWAAGCGVIRAQGLAPHGLRVLEAALALLSGRSSRAASGWVCPWVPSRLGTTPGPVSLRCLHGIATVLLRYIPGVCSHVDAINMGAYTGDIPGIYRVYTVAAGLGVCAPKLEKPAGSRPKKALTPESARG
jgi:hypothetical protein